ncbi:type IV pilin protein [Massilia sp. TS11]|uniref:type IV pilin protein n=1 Tax=Massilia sp. TS11 TaxID=2908003 RepID=UPI001EDA4A4C|nr:type IV pilin protein [Massilia sp. TS11]MCG2586139.1 type IV pilin protein [Massilia sp. TS11]
MKRRGFSLLELLVVLTIIGLLAMLAYPSYAAYVTRTRRSEGQIALLEILHQQERYFTLHNRFAAFSAQGGGPDSGRFKWWSGSAPASSAYELSGEACPGRQLDECILLRAEPGTARVDARFRDPDCGTLMLSSEGERRPAPSRARCWP